MKKFILTISLCLFCIVAYAENSPKIDLIPKELQWEGENYYYDPSWKDYERLIKGDLDRDGEEEIVISFSAGLKTEGWKEGDREPFVISIPFYRIYDKTDKGYKPIKTVMGNQYLGEISIEDFSKDDKKQLVLWSSGGSHYTDIYIYQWLDGDYKLIFESGSACGIEADFKATPPKIKIGKEKWNDEGWSYADEPD